ncbi:MAG TPA: alpha/beta fold hydrolase [Oculatellaceae cyanobacterium]|jgi:alpha-beta hydrolase superfamily lysophospholipase
MYRSATQLRTCAVVALAITASATGVSAQDVHSHTWLSPKSHPEIDDHQIPTATWLNPNSKARVKFCLLCIHGLGLNGRSFEYFGKQLAQQGAAVYAIDVRGFGQWQQIEGHSDIDFANTLTDIEKTLKSIRLRYPRLPIFILGESMGGAIALRATALSQESVDGVISSVPAGDRFKQTGTKLKVAEELLSGDNKKHDVGKQVIAQATQDSTMRDHWENDERNRLNYSAKELLRFQKFMNENHEVVQAITKTPVLLVQGCDDRLVKSAASFELFDELPVKDKTFLSLPYEHLIFEEQEHTDKKLNDTTNTFLLVWLQAHIPTAATPTNAIMENQDTKKTSSTSLPSKSQNSSPKQSEQGTQTPEKKRASHHH